MKPGSVLLFEEMDRLSRQKLGKAFSLFVGILTAGVEIITAEKHYTEDSLDDLGTLIGVLVMQKTANEESQKKSQRIRGKMGRVAPAGCGRHQGAPPGKMPAWVCWNGTSFELIEPAGVAIRLVYRLAAEGLGQRRIMEYLNGKNGVPPIGRQAMWMLPYIGKLLSGREVLGDLSLKDGRIYPGYYPAAVAEEDWNRARASMAARTIPGRNQKRPGVGREGPCVTNLFTGLIYGAKDGFLMYVHRYDTKLGGVKHSLVAAGPSTVVGITRRMKRCRTTDGERLPPLRLRTQAG